MSAALAPFVFEGREVRTVVVDGVAWFVANDVAAALGYANAADAIRKHCKGVANRYPLRTAGGEQMFRILNESDVMRLIVSSRLPAAVAFERLVFEEILPTVRATGAYAPALSEDEIVRQALMITSKRVESLEAEVQRLEPAALEAETYRAAEGERAIGDVANELKVMLAGRWPELRVRHRDVFAHAARLGLIIRGGVRNNEPTARAIEAGWVATARHTYKDSRGIAHTKTYARLTPRGEARLREGVYAFVVEHGSLEIKENER